MTREMRGIARARADIEHLSARELRAVAQLAASVGHELRNPLAAVRNANAFIGKKIRGAASLMCEELFFLIFGRACVVR